jgi:ubiquinone/menaquinone biosynthesis C-methylase UbiE
VGVFKKLGSVYDLTRKADPRIVEGILMHLEAKKKDDFLLEIGCGTGNYTIEIHKKEHKIIGLDPSVPMLRQAREKCRDIVWIKDFAEEEPFIDKYIRGVFTVNAVHHFYDMKKAFQQVYNILCENGKFVIFTSTQEQIEHYWLNHYFPKTMEKSKKNRPALQEIKSLLEEVGFVIINCEPYHIPCDVDSLDCFSNSCKCNPSRYLEDEFLNGMTTFTCESVKDDVKKGKKLLHEDIKEDRVSGVIQSYESDKGDYSFIICEKPKG